MDVSAAVGDAPQSLILHFVKDFRFHVLVNTHHATPAYVISEQTIAYNMFVFTRTGRGHRLEEIG